MNREEPFFFERPGARLFGMLHSPTESASKLAFLMSHPFGEEKLWAHRVFVSSARELAARGYPVLRFDYMGAGDSSGLTSETSLETHLADMEAAVHELRRRCRVAERIGVVGLRFGASLAAMFTERAQVDSSLGPLRAGPLVSWDPLVDGEAYFQELLRSNLSTQLAVYGKVVETREVLQERLRRGDSVNVDGYEISPELFVSCARPGLLGPEGRAHTGPVLVLQIAPDRKAVERRDLQSLAATYPSGEFARATEHPFWREIRPFYGRAKDLEGVTLEWLERHDG